MNDEEKRILEICKGNQEAYDFLNLWARYCHEIDDIVDGARLAPEEVIATFALATMVYSHPFYLRNLPALRQVVLLIANMYADSVAWENEGQQWQREFSNCYRHAGNEMVFAVAQLCGGFEHVRSVSAEQREICYRTQHPEGASGIFHSENGTSNGKVEVIG